VGGVRFTMSTAFLYNHFFDISTNTAPKMRRGVSAEMNKQQQKMKKTIIFDGIRVYLHFYCLVSTLPFFSLTPPPLTFHFNR
jgi:hypothetical protein